MNSEHLLELTDSNFDLEVLESDVPVVVNFWAAWYGPCRVVGSVIQRLADEYGKAAKIAKLNVDRNSATALHYKVVSIPAVLLFQEGKVIETLLGVRPYARYAAALVKALPAA